VRLAAAVTAATVTAQSPFRSSRLHVDEASDGDNRGRERAGMTNTVTMKPAKGRCGLQSKRRNGTP
jgi:hypothetical protein